MATTNLGINQNKIAVNAGDSGFFILANLIHIVIKNSIAINTLLETKVMSNLRGEIKKWKSSLL